MTEIPPRASRLRSPRRIVTVPGPARLQDTGLAARRQIAAGIGAGQDAAGRARRSGAHRAAVIAAPLSTGGAAAARTAAHRLAVPGGGCIRQMNEADSCRTTEANPPKSAGLTM
jgi:hypothetical protein